MNELAGINEELSRKEMWSRAILDAAAEISLLGQAMRTQASATLGIADLFLEFDMPGPELKGTQRQHAERFRCSVGNLLTLVTNFLDSSNIEAGHFELEKVEFDLSSLVEQTLQRIRPRARLKNLTLKSVLAPGIPRTLTGDPMRLRQIFENLLDHAVHFTETGEITFTAVANPSNPNRLHFLVGYIGSGTPNPGRDPLGLGVCRMLARQMGGELRARSGSGENDLAEGSWFTCDLLFASSVQEPERDWPVERKMAAKKTDVLPEGQAEQTVVVRVLIAEDSEDSRFLLQEFLKRGPYAVTFAENGRVAVDAALSQPFDLILMDIQMPVMDGLTATRLIREAERQAGRPPTPLLALTSHTRKADITLSLAAGCNAHVSKPISRIGLMTTIARYSPQRTVEEKPSPVELSIPPGLEEAAQRYILSRKNDVPRLLHLIEAKEFEQLRRLAHDMKGTGTSYGFPDVTRLGSLMECSAKLGNAADLSSQMLELSRYVQAASEMTTPLALPCAPEQAAGVRSIG